MILQSMDKTEKMIKKLSSDVKKTEEHFKKMKRDVNALKLSMTSATSIALNIDGGSIQVKKRRHEISITENDFIGVVCPKAEARGERVIVDIGAMLEIEPLWRKVDRHQRLNVSVELRQSDPNVATLLLLKTSESPLSAKTA
eukprot:SAG31_NODE_4391_length_3272_cov_18.210261_2_plen_142_part_00